METLPFESGDWSFDRIDAAYEAIEKIAIGGLGLDVYPNRIEIITAEQMLDAYASVGLPLMYRHWSFGKRFAQDEAMYRKGLRGLAYEIVINSDPCINYLMEENSMTMQTLVMAHAAFGHNHFFKNNGLFRQWTDAGGILSYLEFAKSFVSRCEEKHGFKAVERVLDAAHALMDHGVHRYPKKRLDLRQEEEKERERAAHAERTYDVLWRTLPGRKEKSKSDPERLRREKLRLPEENLLYFLEKNSPRLKPWQRELLRIVRNLAQYFYPQKQTKVMNEGCATYVHYEILSAMHRSGQLTDGAWLEFLHSHTNVVRQAGFDQGGAQWNPYALGFAIFKDVERMCVEPTQEDREWFPAIAGCKDPLGVLRGIWRDYRDESCVLQFLSPKVMRDFRMFAIEDDASSRELLVPAIHDERGYRKVRQVLASQFDVGLSEADIQVVDVDLAGDRRLVLRHRAVNGVRLDPDQVKPTLIHLASLWGYPVVLKEVDAADDRAYGSYEAAPPLDIR